MDKLKQIRIDKKKLELEIIQLLNEFQKKHKVQALIVSIPSEAILKVTVSIE